MPTSRAIVITGPVGAGKTTTAMALAELLEHSDIPCAVVDMDQLRWFHPTPAGDPFGESVGHKHVRYMADTYLDMGLPTFILADVIETQAGRDALAGAVHEYEITIVRLEVAMERLHNRLRGRETERQIAWHLNRAQELQDIMTTNGIGDFVVPVNDETPEQVAETIARELDLTES